MLMGMFDIWRRDPDSPPVVMHPPVIFGLSFLIGYALDVWWGWSFGVGPAIVLGWLLLAGGFAMAVWCFWHLRRAGTNVPTNKPALVLVTDGPYRTSRNPIYVALTAVYIGLASLLDAPAALLMLLAALPMLHFGVVLREEQYLAAKFGEPYRDYFARTKRYI